MISQLRNHCVKLYQFRSYKFSTLKVKGQKISFPFGFRGYDGDVDLQRGMVLEKVIEQFHEAEVLDGFKFAYKSTLDAIVQKDTEFIQDICEPRLFEEFESGFEELEDLGLSFKGEDLDIGIDKIQIVINSISMIYGVKHVRSSNASGSEYSKQSMNLHGTDLVIYQNKNLNPMDLMRLYPFIQVGCVFTSSANINLADSDGTILAGQNSNGSHLFVFEGINEGEQNGISHIQSMAQSMSGMFGSIGFFSNQDGMKNFLRKLFVTKDLAWKIVDIDNHLDGNPFVSNY